MRSPLIPDQEEDAEIEDLRKNSPFVNNDEDQNITDDTFSNDEERGPVGRKQRKHRATDLRGSVVGYYTELHNDETIPFIKLKGYHQRNIVRLLTKYRGDQIVGVVSGCFLMYSLANHGQGIDINLSQAIVITLGSTTFPQQSASIAGGVFVGMSGIGVIINYGWLCLLAAIQSTIWVMFIHFELLVGFSGRLGVSAFISTNATLAIFAMPSRAVSWSFYGSPDKLWPESVHLVPSIIAVGSCIFICIVTGAIRVNAQVPLDPVTIGSQISLLGMLIVLPTNWKYGASCNAGLAVGSFLSMASVEYLPTVTDFAIAGLLAGLWKLFWDPFFLEFGGREGFMAFCGFVTYIAIKKTLARFFGKTAETKEK